MKRSDLALAAIALALSACTNSMGFRDQRCGPDQRLAEALHAYECSRDGRCNQNEGHVLVDCGRARNELERLAFEFPGHVPTLMANAAVAYESKDPVKATRFLDRLFDIEHAHPEAAILRGRIAIEAGNLPYARRMLESQVRYRPDHYGLREAHSAALYMSMDFEGARAALDVAEQLGAPAWRIAYHRGLIAEAAGQAREAERLFQDALRDNPSFEPAEMRLRGMQAIGDAAAGDVDGPYGTGPEERSYPGLATLSGQTKEKAK